MEHVTGVVILVGAGGQRDHIMRRIRDGRPEGGIGDAVFDHVGRRTQIIDITDTGHHAAGKKVKTVSLLRRNNVHIRMLIIEALGLVLDHLMKHTAALHIVAVDHRILVGEIILIPIVRKNRAVTVPGTVQ